MTETESRDGAGIESGEHPSDRLPEYVRGTAPDPEEVEAHLASCSRCRREVELVRALAGHDPALEEAERERVWRRLAPGLRPAGRDGPAWLSGAWKVAAAAALVAMGFGVWQVNRQASVAGEWDPSAAIRGWEEDLRALRPAPEDVRLALGHDPEDGGGVPWGEADGGDPAGMRVPWKEEPR